MGQDKALLRLRPGDPPLLQLVLDQVGPLTTDLFIVGPSRPGYDQFGIPIVPDLAPGLGPLAGIAAALAHARHSACLVVACDMPFLNPALLRHMVERPRSGVDALVPLIPADPANPDSTLVYQSLHAIYQRTCFGPIQRQLATGNRRVSGFYPEVRLQTVTAAEANAYDPDLRSFVSLNTPEAVARARDWR